MNRCFSIVTYLLLTVFIVACAPPASLEVAESEEGKPDADVTSPESDDLINMTAQQEPFASVLPLYDDYRAWAEVEGDFAIVEFFVADDENETEVYIGYALFEDGLAKPSNVVAVTPDERQNAERVLQDIIESAEVEEVTNGASALGYFMLPVGAGLWEAGIYDKATEMELVLLLFDANTSEVLELERAGIEEAERNIEPDPNAIRVALLGDSITAGEPGDNYGLYLGEMLGEEYQVLNYGVGSACVIKRCPLPIWDTSDYAALLISDPAIVTVMLGSNDSPPFEVPEDVFADFEQDYADLIAQLRNLPSQPRILVAFPPPTYRWSEASDERIRTEIIPVVERIAADNGLETIDTYNGVKDYETNWPDDLHPNQAANQALAALFAEAILAQD